MIELLEGLAAWQVLAVVAGVGLVEGTGVLGYVVPGMLTLAAAGTLASAGVVSLPVVLAVAISSAVVGDSIGYGIGRLSGPRLEASRLGQLVGQARWSRARTFLSRHGFSAVAAGRWFGPVRAIVPLLAGATQLSYGRFLRANVLGVVSYATTVLLVSYGAGALLARVGAGVVAATPWVLAVAIAGGLVVLTAGRPQPARVRAS